MYEARITSPTADQGAKWFPRQRDCPVSLLETQSDHNILARITSTCAAPIPVDERFRLMPTNSRNRWQGSPGRKCPIAGPPRREMIAGGQLTITYPCSSLVPPVPHTPRSPTSILVSM